LYWNWFDAMTRADWDAVAANFDPDVLVRTGRVLAGFLASECVPVALNVFPKLFRERSFGMPRKCHVALDVV
jgi:hypothetical protein